MYAIRSYYVVDSFTYTITDIGGTNYNGTLDVAIQDDKPVIDDTTSIAVEIPQYYDTNMLITLDVSGSMTTNVNGQTRFDIAKEALIDTINAYVAQANGLADEVNVNLTLFNRNNFV